MTPTAFVQGEEVGGKSHHLPKSLILCLGPGAPWMRGCIYDPWAEDSVWWSLLPEGTGFRLLRLGLRFLYCIDAMGSVLSPKRGGQTWLSMKERLS